MNDKPSNGNDLEKALESSMRELQSQMPPPPSSPPRMLPSLSEQLKTLAETIAGLDRDLEVFKRDCDGRIEDFRKRLRSFK